ncbi:hypothetical protein HDU67_005204, partial [Dinochytrium kinnereticum]
MVSTKRVSFLKLGPTGGKGIAVTESSSSLQNCIANVPRSLSADGSIANVTRIDQPKSSPQTTRASAVQSHRGTLKVGLMQVLNDELDSPFSLAVMSMDLLLADFYLFLRKEHSEENIEFYEEVERYKAFAKTNFSAIPSPLTSEEPQPSESTDSEETIQFRDELKLRMAKIMEVYFTTGAEKELNIPANIRKRLMSEVKEKKNLYPDVFAPAIEN